jgi:acid phosphatase family membrane protein YuiD
MDEFIELISNKIFLSACISFIITGILKIIFHFISEKKFDLKVMFKTGGMPSSHTAFVVSSSSAIYLLEGISNLFILSLVLTFIVVVDAVGLRRAVGKQAAIINNIIDEFMKSKKIKPERLYELLGHTPLQALIGFIIGIIVTHIVFLF